MRIWDQAKPHELTALEAILQAKAALQVSSLAGAPVVGSGKGSASGFLHKDIAPNCGLFVQPMCRVTPQETIAIHCCRPPHHA